MKTTITLILGMMRQGTDIRIVVRNKNVDSALRILKRKTKDALIDLRSKEHYEKPSEKRHRMKQAAKIREHKRQKDENKTKRRRH